MRGVSILRNMKRILLATIFIWVSVGLIQLVIWPDTFPNRIYTVPLLLVAAVLVPLGFVISIKKFFTQKSKVPLIYSIIFLGVFLFDIDNLIEITHRLETERLKIRELSYDLGKKFPIVEGPTSAETETERLNMAQYVYREYGARVPYRLESGEYQIYDPTGKDVEVFNTNKAMFEKATKTNEYAISVLRESRYMLLAKIILFFVVVSVYFLIEYKNANKRMQPDAAKLRR